jgi:Ran GTPase-activating protein (RanGAP) involved in mRNA processing and transport
MLRNEAPFGPLRVHHLRVVTVEAEEEEEEEEEERVDDADLLELAVAMRQPASLESVWLQDVPLDTPAVLDALVDASLARGIPELNMECCNLSSASVPALVRLLGSAVLTELQINNDGRQLLDAPAAALLADALRANTTLRAVKLDLVDLFCDAAAGVAVVRALRAHPSLVTLCVINSNVGDGDAAAVGAALGALLAANAPALRELNISWCSLGDAGLTPLLDALAANTHLRMLHCEDNDMSDACARDTFLPAIRANSSLRELLASETWGGVAYGVAPQEVLRAEALVQARTKAESVPV